MCEYSFTFSKVVQRQCLFTQQNFIDWTELRVQTSSRCGTDVMGSSDGHKISRLLASPFYSSRMFVAKKSILLVCTPVMASNIFTIRRRQLLRLKKLPNLISEFWLLDRDCDRCPCGELWWVEVHKQSRL
ncbi:MAG: hypothetical protein EZS28_010452 [Streblomastix strix]|uniref:Uncharacterized protein n=1 Tax=Streblomastix strix TaxID=222440 RepID=A0A5J4WG89_9EUKA|nr:MAG: hypothetical protein EZS28_010452 [Streblomastix strix]